MTLQQWALFNAAGELLCSYPSEAAAYNDPASQWAHVRVRSTGWAEAGPDSHYVGVGPWLATSPDDPLWGPRDTPGYTGPTPAGLDLLRLLALVCVLVAAGAGGGWVAWHLLAR